ncbi:MAG: metalloregulator ArsR/SmtB family transcription factor [Deltaproteobacteria bacterium]|nr:metalloregulator ArsR/SmtB family transcription factor [Deltaproteobacteria bacterium]
MSPIFSALADPTRRAILDRLANGESSVTELAEPFSISLPAISKHLRVLEGAGLLSRDIDGRVHRCRLNAEPIRAAVEWMARYRLFWETRFDSLARYLEQTGKEHGGWNRTKPRQRSLKSGAGLPPKGASLPGVDDGDSARKMVCPRR